MKFIQVARWFPHYCIYRHVWFPCSKSSGVDPHELTTTGPWCA